MYKQIKKWRNDAIAIVVLIISIVAVFWWVPHTYFQQDEWYLMGQFLLAKTDPFIIFRVFQGMHFLPVEQVWLFLQYAVFWLDPVGYVIISLVSHIFVVVLGYILLRMLFHRVVPSFIGMAFFALNPISSQVVVWSPASASGALSAILFLLGCIIWVYFRKKQSRIADVAVGVLMFLSMLAKVDMIMGYFFIFVCLFFFVPKGNISSKPIILSFILWLVLYVYIWIFGVKENFTRPSRTITDLITYASQIPEWMANCIINHNTLRVFLNKMFGPYVSYLPIIDNDVVIKAVCWVFAGIWYMWYLCIVVIKREPIVKIFLFPFFVAVSMFPYFFTMLGELQSRHYYIPVFFVGMWITFFLDWLGKKKLFLYQKISFLTLVMIIVIFGIGNQPWPDYLPSQKKRATIVAEMQRITVPTETTVVYFLENGDQNPFLSGIGNMLLVMQGHDDSAFAPYFRTMFLFDIYEQGFQKVGEKGFGYYYDLDRLKKDYEDGLFDDSSIRAYVFDTEKLTFSDITEKILKALY